MAILVACLYGVEHFLRFLLHTYQDSHPVLEPLLNRKILARHIGVDVLCCMVVAWYGYLHRAICMDAFLHAMGKNTMPRAGYESRIFTYHPGSMQLLFLFLTYQAKNMVDTIVWNDGLLFVVHHLLAGGVAWGGMYPGVAHFYAIFFMGLSEISTGILCILANFDDEHGVPGLGDAFPILKAAIGVLFVIAFITLRSIVWPYMSMHFVRDVQMAIKADGPQLQGRKFTLNGMMYCLVGLSFLQFVWLIQIFILAKEEIGKLL